MKLLVLITVVFLFATNLAAEPDAAPEQGAEEEAIAWLALVDEGEFRESWYQACSHFQKAITVEEWLQAVTTAREPMGKLISRKLIHLEYETTLSGMPDGEYVVIQYRTVLEKKARATETITTMMDDGKWRVAGYYVK